MGLAGSKTGRKNRSWLCILQLLLSILNIRITIIENKQSENRKDLMIISQYVSVDNFLYQWIVYIILSITSCYVYELFRIVASNLRTFSQFNYNILTIRRMVCSKNGGIWCWFQNLNALPTIHSILILISIFLLTPLPSIYYLLSSKLE